jgi:hypothetical protein
MLREAIDGAALTAGQLASAVHSIIESAPRDAVLSIQVTGELGAESRQRISAAELRRMAPPTMNVDIRLEAMVRFRAGYPASRTATAPSAADQLGFAM